MQTMKPPRLSRDLQRHLGKQLGARSQPLIEEPLPQRMRMLLDHLSTIDLQEPAPDSEPDEVRRAYAH
jgi:hypothetical protein